MDEPDKNIVTNIIKPIATIIKNIEYEVKVKLSDKLVTSTEYYISVLQWEKIEKILKLTKPNIKTIDQIPIYLLLPKRFPDGIYKVEVEKNSFGIKQVDFENSDFNWSITNKIGLGFDAANNVFNKTEEAINYISFITKYFGNNLVEVKQAIQENN